MITLLQPVSSVHLQKLMGLERHALYYHLKVLEDCELIAKEKGEGRKVTYTTFAEDIVIGPHDDPDWQRVSRRIVRTSMRRIANRLDAVLQTPPPEDAPAKFRTGSMTLFLNDQGRQVLRDRLDRLWDELEEFQEVPKEDEKPYYFVFGFAPESYGQD